ncbi:MAG: uncharacterized protein JWO23_1428 [Solirubrobacterales bacterium]|jgi:hypothetical protein|nr:uncharacterized protein [Solirubrobacterales bacterium]
MALETQELARGDWKPYFDDFSRDLDRLTASVEVAGRDVGAQIEADRLILTGITYDDRDDVVVIGLDAKGGLTEELEHMVYKPQKIFVASGDDGRTAIDIEDGEGNQTLVRLEPAT